MNEVNELSDLKWIACEGVSLNPYNLSVPERLREFGYALVFDEFGNGKTDKAQLCIHNTISAIDNFNAIRSSKEDEKKPSILIVCPESLLQNWYSSLVSEMGVDFKFLSDMNDTVLFYSKSISNLFIISAEQLKHVKQTKSGGITGDSKLVWDLMIIDAGGSLDGADWDGYYENCSNKAKKLLVFAPCPFPYDEDLSSSALNKMIKRFLHDSEHKNEVTNVEIDEQIIIFDRKTPVMRYCIPGKTGGRGPNVVTLEYEVNKDVFDSSNRLALTHTGAASYIYGGNAFEEYNPKVKGTYMHPHYDRADVEILRVADAKLAIFLDKLDDVLKTPENNAVVYFSSKATLDYINKVINTIYPDLKDQILVQTDSVLDAAVLKRRFIGKKAVPARIILAGDAIDEKYYGVQFVTHVFNYEYPDNPALLERRYLRTGRTLQTGVFEIGNLRPREFIIFSDKDMMFDGRLLAKVLPSRLPTCFKKKIPSRNVLFWVNSIEKYIADTLEDLKSVVESIASKGKKISEAEFVRLSWRFCGDYSITDLVIAESPEKLHNHAEKLFDDLIGLLDVNNATTVFAQNLEDYIGKSGAESVKIVKKSVETIRRGYLYYDELMNPRLIRNTNNPSEIAKKYEHNNVVKGVERAVKMLDSMIEKVDACKGEYPFIRNTVNELPDGLKTAVLFNIWKYCRFRKGYNQTLKEFMELYNKGVI
jgi:hypothetical protein